MNEVLDAPKLSAVKVYNPIEAGIALMLEKHGHVLTKPPVVTNDAKALTQAKTDRRELVKFRTTLEAARKSEKAESLAYGRLVDSEAARLQGFADPIETAYSKAIDDEEARIEAEAAALRLAEQQRIEAIQIRITEIKNLVSLALASRTSEMVEELISKLTALSTDGFDEFEPVALEARTATYERLKQISDARFAEETEAKRVKAEQEAESARLLVERQANEAAAAELEVQRKAIAAAEAVNKAESDRLAAERAELEQKSEPEPALAIVNIAPAAIEIEATDNSTDTPSAAALVKVVAFEFGVELHTAAEWIERRIDDIRAFNA